MLHKSIRRGGLTLALMLALALSGATPASAQGFGFGPRSMFDWLADLFGFTILAEDTNEGNSGGLSGVWEMEGAGFDPFGQPILPNGNGNGETTDEGAGFDPFGLS